MNEGAGEGSRVHTQIEVGGKLIFPPSEHISFTQSSTLFFFCLYSSLFGMADLDWSTAEQASEPQDQGRACLDIHALEQKRKQCRETERESVCVCVCECVWELGRRSQLSFRFRVLIDCWSCCSACGELALQWVEVLDAEQKQQEYLARAREQLQKSTARLQASRLRLRMWRRVRNQLAIRVKETELVLLKVRGVCPCIGTGEGRRREKGAVKLWIRERGAREMETMTQSTCT